MLFLIGLFIIYALYLLVFAVQTDSVVKYNNSLKIDKNDKQPFSDLLDNDDDKVNCVERPRRCVVNKDCAFLCSNVAYCEQSLCRDVKWSETEIVEQKKCNAEHGFVAVLMAFSMLDPIWKCLPTLPHLYKENGQKQDFTCVGGILRTDVTKRPSTINDCSCIELPYLGYYDDTPLIPRCVNDPNIVSNFNIVQYKPIPDK